jgi:hypothetical protein
MYVVATIPTARAYANMYAIESLALTTPNVLPKRRRGNVQGYFVPAAGPPDFLNWDAVLCNKYE